jgi:hypothetical protein
MPVKSDITFPGHSPDARGRISPLNAWPICGRICGRFVDCCAEVEGITRELGKIEELADCFQGKQITYWGIVKMNYQEFF